MMGTSIRGLLGVATSAAEIAGAGVRQVARTLTEGSGEDALGGVQRMRDMVRSEVQRSIGQLGGVSPAEVADLRHRVAVLEGRLALAEERAEQPGPEQPARRAAKKAAPARAAKKASARPARGSSTSRRRAPAGSAAAEGSRPAASLGPDTPETVADVAEVSPLAEG